MVNNPQTIRQDDLILADAWLALWKAEESGCLDTSGLQVKVCGCNLQAEGKMENLRQCRLAKRLLTAIIGVKQVHIDLVIQK